MHMKSVLCWRVWFHGPYYPGFCMSCMIWTTDKRSLELSYKKALRVLGRRSPGTYWETNWPTLSLNHHSHPNGLKCPAGQTASGLLHIIYFSLIYFFIVVQVRFSAFPPTRYIFKQPAKFLEREQTFSDYSCKRRRRGEKEKLKLIFLYSF